MYLLNHVDASRWSLLALMSFVDYTVFNGSAAEFTDINVGGDDVAAGASANATLTDAELAAVCVLNGAAVMQTAPTAAEKAAIIRTVINLEGLDAVVALEPAAFAAKDRSGGPLLRRSGLSIAYGADA